MEKMEQLQPWQYIVAKLLATSNAVVLCVGHIPVITNCSNTWITLLRNFRSILKCVPKNSLQEHFYYQSKLYVHSHNNYDYCNPILNTQAKHMIIMWESREQVKLPCPAGDFLKTNWGDQIEMHEGKQLKNKTTSSLVKVIDKLSDAQWEKIMEMAISASKQEFVPVHVEEVLDSDLESNFELADNDKKEGQTELEGLQYHDDIDNSIAAEEYMNIDTGTYLEGSKQ